MRMPTELDKAKIDMAQVAAEIASDTGLRLESADDALSWMKGQGDYIIICPRVEAGFEDWTEHDYAVNVCSKRGRTFEPYASFTKNFVVIHNYH